MCTITCTNIYIYIYICFYSYKYICIYIYNIYILRTCGLERRGRPQYCECLGKCGPGSEGPSLVLRRTRAPAGQNGVAGPVVLRRTGRACGPERRAWTWVLRRPSRACGPEGKGSARPMC